MKVTRDDIQDFPGDTIDLIMKMQKDGWRAQRSNRNHVMLLGPDGVTRYSASRNPDSAKYLAEDLRRYMKKKDIVEVTEEKVEVKKLTDKFWCPQTGCFKSFDSQNKLNVHIGVDHEGLILCPEEGCYELLRNNRAVGRHRQIKHGYQSPKYAARKKLEAERAKAKEEETANFSRQIDLPTSAEITSIFETTDNKKLEDSRVEEILGIEKEDDAVVGRDSWVLDLKDLMDLSVETVLKTMYAAGLGMEIRVWKEE